MKHGTDMSRREFASLAAGAPLVRHLQPAAAIVTVQDVIDRIRDRIGVEWNATSTDGLKAGDAAATVTGIVTTALATVPVLRQAAASGANLVITAHPTFYSRTDAPGPLAGDPILSAKQALIAKQRLAVYRLHQHWRLRTPDPAAQGFGDALGWARHRVGADPARYEIPAVSLDALLRHVKASLGSRGGVRVVGDVRVRVRRVALLPGSTPLPAALAALPAADAVIAGEMREWESVEYARDVVHAGGRKALILVGRVVSEEPGMEACAAWLKTLVPGVPIRHVAAGDPYWRPR